MQKLQRNYYAEFKIKEQNQKTNEFEETQVITVKYPTTIRIQIQLGALGGANSAAIQFINLDTSVQALLWRDMFNNGTKQIEMSLYAGYQNTMPLIFKGSVISCTSYRASGSVDTITSIEAFEGGNIYQYGFINATVAKNTKFKDVLSYMLEGDENVKLGAVSPEIADLKRDTTFIGQVMDLLNRNYSGYNTFIEKGKFHILADDELLEGDLLVITEESGLLGSPRRSNIFTEVDMLFEPQLRIGQGVSLISKNPLFQQKGFNQAYKVSNIRHYGVISPRESGKLLTTVTLSVLPKKYKKVEEVKPTTYNSNNVSNIWKKPIAEGIGKITSPFGKRPAPLPGGKGSTNHRGIDIGAPLNTPVYAPANGQVVFSAYDGVNGEIIRIDNGIIDGQHVRSAYAHLASRVVKQYQNVSQGELIGYVGSTGKDEKGESTSSGPHLHFGITEDMQPVNPVKYIGNY